MTTNTPGWSGTLPDPADRADVTRWAAPAGDYGQGEGGVSAWAEADPPAAAPPVIAEGPQTRPGWLLAGRSAE